MPPRPSWGALSTTGQGALNSLVFFVFFLVRRAQALFWGGAVPTFWPQRREWLCVPPVAQVDKSTPDNTVDSDMSAMDLVFGNELYTGATSVFASFFLVTMAWVLGAWLRLHPTTRLSAALVPSR